SAQREALIRLHALLGELSLLMRQGHLDVDRLLRAETEVSVRLLARAPAVADGDFAIAEQGIGLAELARLVDAHARTDAHAIDAVATLDEHGQPVAAFRLVAQDQRA